MRIAPSSRTLSPLKYPLVIISSANAAYFVWPAEARFGNGTEAASPALTRSGARCSGGVSKML
jgi:hypothetical protein